MDNQINSNCIICGSGYTASQLTGLLECKHCHFITTDMDISAEDLRGLYQGNYFCGGEYADYLSDKETIQKTSRRRLEVLLRFVEHCETKTLLEVGCAYGFFLDLARERFAKVYGIDISSDAVKYSTEVLRLNVMSGDYLCDNLEADYDVCCVWDTIEHLKEPHLFVKKISAKIAQGGILAITTGDIQSLNARIRGRRWRQIRPPIHLHYFSQKTLTDLLERNGFEVIYAAHPGSYMSLKNISHIILVARNNFPRLNRILNHVGLLRMNIYLNMLDLLYVIARKHC